MIRKNAECPSVQMLAGISRKTLVHGEKTLLAEFTIQKGSELPHHNHPYEQTGYLVKGKLEMIIDGESVVFTPGDGWCIPENVYHSATAHEDCIAIEVFAPARQDYID